MVSLPQAYFSSNGQVIPIEWVFLLFFFSLCFLKNMEIIHLKIKIIWPVLVWILIEQTQIDDLVKVVLEK